MSRLLVFVLPALLACSPSRQPDAAPRAMSTGQPMRVQGDVWYSDVPASGMKWRFDDGHARLEHRGRSLEIETITWGREHGSAVALHSPTLGDCLTDRTTPRGDCLRPLELRSGALTERWISRADGLEQTWTLATAPAGEGPLAIDLSVRGATLRVRPGAATMTLAPSHTVHLGGLRAWGADGRSLPAWFEPSEDGLRVRVDDRGAKYPVEVDPLYTAPAWSLEDVDDRIAFGASLGVEDVDGDGREDLLVGARDASSGEGDVLIYRGPVSSSSATADLRLEGIGWVVSAPGDFDGDGYGDLAAGDPDEDDARGAVTICPGGPDGPGDDCDLVLWGTGSGASFGESAAAMDLNDDGYDDLVIGAPGGAGSVNVFYGSSVGLPADPDLTIDGSGSDDGLGTSVGRAGDVNGDGIDDLIYGAPGAGGVGSATVVHGSSTGLDTSTGVTLSGAADSLFGQSVSGAGDVNNDGFDDVLVGAPGARQATAYHGSSSGISSAAASILTSTRTSGYGTGEDAFAWGVAPFADVDSDGYDDVVVGIESFGSSRSAYVFRGSSTGLATRSTATISSTSTTGFAAVTATDLSGDGKTDRAISFASASSNDGYVELYTKYSSRSTSFTSLKLSAPVWYEGYGAGAAPLGDVNGDGYADVLLWADTDEQWLLYYGSDAGPSDSPALTFTAPTDRTLSSSSALEGPCDVNGDGYGDVLLSTTDAFEGVTLSLYLGAATGPSSAASEEIELDTNWSAHCVGDVTGDGAADVFLWGTCDPDVAPDTAGGGGGSDEICMGLLRGDSDGLADAIDDRLESSSMSSDITRVGPAGDVNGDGIGDVLVGGADKADSSYGLIYVFHGSTDGLSATPDFSNVARGYDLGRNTSDAGDVNGDGYDDILAATYDSEYSSAAELYVFYGSADGVSASGSWYTTYTEWSDLDLTTSDDPKFDGLGDMDGDGTDDFVLGGPRGSGSSSARPLMVFSGSTAALSEDPSAIFYPFEDAENAPDIICVYNVGDVNGDGLDDLLTCSGGSGYTYIGHYDIFYSYRDVDGDGIPSLEDCDDTDPLAEPSTFYADADGDGAGDASVSVSACEAPDGYVEDASDCDDDDASAFPSAVELCDGADDDCDGMTDEDDALDATSWFLDGDGDGHGDPEVSEFSCAAPSGYVAIGTDCDDGDATLSPDAVERCDGLDNDCDGASDEDDASDAGTWYLDSDGDGYGDPEISQAACAAPPGHVADGTDCDDLDTAVNPGALEVCDGLDNDCEGGADEDAADSPTWYCDGDGDGHGDAGCVVTGCEAPEGYVASADDCDDAAGDSFPGAEEVPGDGLDQDCDGLDATDDESDTADSPVKPGGCGASAGDGGGCSTGSRGVGFGGALLAFALVRSRRRR